MLKVNANVALVANSQCPSDPFTSGWGEKEVVPSKNRTRNGTKDSQPTYREKRNRERENEERKSCSTTIERGFWRLVTSGSVFFFFLAPSLDPKPENWFFVQNHRMSRIFQLIECHRVPNIHFVQICKVDVVELTLSLSRISWFVCDS